MKKTEKDSTENFTVKQLIEELSKFKPETPVVMWSYADESYGDFIGSGWTLEKRSLWRSKTKNDVFYERTDDYEQDDADTDSTINTVLLNNRYFWWLVNDDE